MLGRKARGDFLKRLGQDFWKRLGQD